MWSLNLRAARDFAALAWVISFLCFSLAAQGAKEPKAFTVGHGAKGSQSLGAERGGRGAQAHGIERGAKGSNDPEFAGDCTIPRPSRLKHAATARWLVACSSWGSVSTSSIHLEGSPFGNVHSMSDLVSTTSSGTPYFYLTPMDPTVTDTQADPRASLALVENAVGTCVFDPDDPLCVKLTLSGRLEEVPGGSAEYEAALDGMFRKHPEMKHWPAKHGFTLFALRVSDVFLIDFFGAAKSIPLPDYFSAVLPPAAFREQGRSKRHVLGRRLAVLAPLVFAGQDSSKNQGPGTRFAVNAGSIGQSTVVSNENTAHLPSAVLKEPGASTNQALETGAGSQAESTPAWEQPNQVLPGAGAAEPQYPLARMRGDPGVFMHRPSRSVLQGRQFERDQPSALASAANSKWHGHMVGGITGRPVAHAARVGTGSAMRDGEVGYSGSKGSERVGGKSTKAVGVHARGSTVFEEMIQQMRGMRASALLSIVAATAGPSLATARPRPLRPDGLLQAGHPLTSPGNCSIPRPGCFEHAATARWLVACNAWGVVRNIQSVSDLIQGVHLGTPYFYLTTLDPTAADAERDPLSTFTLSEDPLGTCNVDPENPLCAKVTLTGNLERLHEGSEEHEGAIEGLFEKHPEMRTWPADHGFAVYALRIQDIFLIDFFGGPKPVTPSQYYAVKL